MIYLLDASVLIPLLVADHEHHAAAADWMAGRQTAVCPFTELAYLRIVTGIYRADQTAARKALQDFRLSDRPRLIAADLSPLDASAFPSAQKSTDWYLCELANKHGMKLATFDGGMKHPAAEILEPTRPGH